MRKSTAVKSMLKTFEKRIKAGNDFGAEDMRRRILDLFNKQTEVIQERNLHIAKLDEQVARLSKQLKTRQEFDALRRSQ